MSDLLPCPFCGARMIVRQRSAFHPGGSGLVTSECWLADYELDEHDYPSWNRRTPASTVLPEARSADTPTSPNAREAALEEAAKIAEGEGRSPNASPAYCAAAFHIAMCIRSLSTSSGE
jgi:hypothetical protein